MILANYLGVYRRQCSRRPPLNKARWRLRAWQQRRIAIRKLRQMDDHLLADVGVARDDIKDFVRDRSSPQWNKGAATGRP